MFGVIEKTVVFEDVTLAKNLLNKGKAELQELIDRTVSIEVSAVDLHNIDVNIDAFCIGNNVRVISKPHGLDRYFLLSKLHLSLDSVSSCTMTLGTTFKSFTQKQIESEKRLDETTQATSKNVTEAKQDVQKLGEQMQKVNTIITGIPTEYLKTKTFEEYKKEVTKNLEDTCTIQDIEKRFAKLVDFEDLRTRVEALENANEGGKR